MDKRAHAVLLRGVNLGAHNKLPMPALREALRDAGFEGVATLFQSGNVVVVDERPPAAVASAVHDLVADRFMLDVPVLALDRAELAGVVDACPMPEQAAGNGKFFNVLFLEKPVTQRLLAVWDPAEGDPGNVHVGDRALYQWCPTGFHLAPQLLPQVERRWQMTGTVRNWNTTTQLLDLLTAAESRQ